MDAVDVLDNLSGKTVEFLDNWSKPSNVTFFKPFSSYSDAAFRTASIVAAPFALALFSTLFVVITGVELFGALYSAMTLNFSAARFNVEQGLSSLGTVLQILALAVASPFINTVDTIGAGVTTLMQWHEQSNDEQPQSESQVAP